MGRSSSVGGNSSYSRSSARFSGHSAASQRPASRFGTIRCRTKADVSAFRASTSNGSMGRRDATTQDKAVQHGPHLTHNISDGWMNSSSSQRDPLVRSAAMSRTHSTTYGSCAIMGQSPTESTDVISMKYSLSGRHAWWTAEFSLDDIDTHASSDVSLLAALQASIGRAVCLKLPKVDASLQRIAATRARDRLVKYLTTEAVAWVRVQYLRELHANGQRLPRRQGIPEEQLVTFSNLEDVEAAAAKWVVSHPWRSARHPDPDGAQLSLLVCELDRLGAGDEHLVFYDFASLHQHDLEDNSLWEILQERQQQKKCGVKERLWTKWPRPGQHPAVRSRKEQMLFEAALCEVELLYSCSSNRVVVLPLVDQGCDIDVGYPVDPRQCWQRGWCIFEICVSSLFGTLANGDDTAVAHLLSALPLNSPGDLKQALSKQACFTCGSDARHVVAMLSRLYRWGSSDEKVRFLLAGFADAPPAVSHCSLDFLHRLSDDSGNDKFVAGFEARPTQAVGARIGAGDDQCLGELLPEVLGSPAFAWEFTTCLELLLNGALLKQRGQQRLDKEPQPVVHVAGLACLRPDFPDSIELRGGRGEPVYVTAVSEMSRPARAGLCEGYELVALEQWHAATARWATETNFRVLPPTQILSRGRLQLPCRLTFHSPLNLAPNLSERQIAACLGIKKVKELHLHRLVAELQQHWTAIDITCQEDLKRLRHACSDDLVVRRPVIVNRRKLEVGTRLREAASCTPPTLDQDESGLNMPDKLWQKSLPVTLVTDGIALQQFRQALLYAGIRWLTGNQERNLFDVLQKALHHSGDEMGSDSGEEEWKMSLTDHFVFDDAGSFTHVGRAVTARHVLAITAELKRLLCKRRAHGHCASGRFNLKDFQAAMLSGGVTWLSQEHIAVIYGTMKDDDEMASFTDWISKFVWKPSEAADEVQRVLGETSQRRGRGKLPSPIRSSMLNFSEFQDILFHRVGVRWLTSEQQRVLFETLNADGKGWVSRDEILRLAKRREELEIDRSNEDEYASGNQGVDLDQEQNDENENNNEET